jgi:hypothetical protein
MNNLNLSEKYEFFKKGEAYELIKFEIELKGANVFF